MNSSQHSTCKSLPLLFGLALILDLATATFAQDSDYVKDESESTSTPKIEAPDKAEKSTDANDSYEFKKIPNVYYAKESDYKLLCDIYQPEGDGPFPALIAIHGGAWRNGSKLQMLRPCLEIRKSWLRRHRYQLSTCPGLQVSRSNP